MEKRRLGNSNLMASVIGFGAWAAGKAGWGNVDEQEIMEAIQTAYDHGVNFFDTAPFYGFGESERILGKALKPVRDKVIIATKFGLVWNEKGDFVKDASRKNILREIDQSLKNLNTDYIDLYQVHWPDDQTPIEETMETLNELVEKGKVRYIGVSNFSVEQMEEARKYANVVSLQSLYNLLQRDVEKAEYPYTEKNGMGFIPYSPLAQGLLTGKFTPPITLSSNDVRRQFNPLFQEGRFEENLKKVEKIRTVAERYNKPTAQVAVNWLLAKPAVTTVITGAKNKEQIMQNIASSEWKLTGEDVARLDKLTAV
ncbi:aldo/keto reductase [Thermoactinomyces intermedius]|jgi:aryl-alcohol dehydrogenase-like predicted oxidoreductase|uniref:Aldo/keto reductase n=1 Tax=Thermoactinomyces intermedius TaxID=2024 RepID=A0A8I1DGA9_THEIN|nr:MULTISPECIES: aldo/keto reductase [Thermoactinomyces]MBA4550105.1 aldo/keto reductase [Thermoactinomyces intermedius]MBA4837741.1 aldo/keto reductase [Thermoactinomyces intermedius]MBH8596430.1 aldo/keto reductase [Thermoactinomyces intermedius]MBH8602543.1 aldo/keto reductase [Thermoactinomyces sp. CICC 23799]